MEAGTVSEAHPRAVWRAFVVTGSFIVLFGLASAAPAHAETPEGRDLEAAIGVLTQSTAPLTGSTGDTVRDLEGVVDHAVSETADRVNKTVRRAVDTVREPVNLVESVVETDHRATGSPDSPRAPAPAEELRTTGHESHAAEARDIDDVREVVRKPRSRATDFPIGAVPSRVDGASQLALRTGDEPEPRKGSPASVPESTSTFSRAFDQLGSPAAVLAALTALSMLFPRGFGLSEPASGRTRANTSGIPPG